MNYLLSCCIKAVHFQPYKIQSSTEELTASEVTTPSIYSVPHKYQNVAEGFFNEGAGHKVVAQTCHGFQNKKKKKKKK